MMTAHVKRAFGLVHPSGGNERRESSCGGLVGEDAFPSAGAVQRLIQKRDGTYVYYCMKPLS